MIENDKKTPDSEEPIQQTEVETLVKEFFASTEASGQILAAAEGEGLNLPPVPRDSVRICSTCNGTGSRASLLGFVADQCSVCKGTGKVG